MTADQDRREKQREAWKELQIIIKRYRALGFDYVVKRIPPAKICFGTTTVRDVVPQKTAAMSPLMIRIVQKPIISEEVTLARKKSKPKKKILIGLMSSKTPRFFYDPYPYSDKFHNPNDYAKRPKISKSPFGRSLYEKEYKSMTPGPGSYLGYRQERKSIFQHSFGGSIRVVPAVETICMSIQLTMCINCHQIPIGDYWTSPSKDSVAYCRPCMKEEIAITKSKTKTLPNRRLEELNSFKLVRHCGYFHDHPNNTKACIKTIPKDELERKYRRENYLSMFYM